MPNYNGYQPDAEGNLVFNPDSYVAVDEPFLTYPDGYRRDHRLGCMYDPQWDLPILSTTSQNGGADWSNHSYSHSTNLVYFPYGANPVAHCNGAAANGLRAIGQYQTGGILALRRLDRRGRVAQPPRHGHVARPGTADDGVRPAVRRPDRRPPAGDGRRRRATCCGSSRPGPASRRRRSPTRSTASSTSPSSPAGSTNPYGDSVTQGDSLWAFKLGGTYTTESGSQEGPDTAPLSIRRPVSGAAVEGATVDNTVYSRGRSRTADTAAARDSMSHERHAADAHAGAGGHDGDVPEPGRGDVPELPEPEAALRDAVLRGRVQRQAAAGRELPVHVRPCR